LSVVAEKTSFLQHNDLLKSVTPAAAEGMEVLNKPFVKPNILNTETYTDAGTG